MLIAIALIFAIIVALVVSAAFIFFAVLYFRDEAKARRLLATIALFYKSTEKTRQHKRAGESKPHAHGRAEDALEEPPPQPRSSAPRKSLLMTITDVLREDIPKPPTQTRRKSDR